MADTENTTAATAASPAQARRAAAAPDAPATTETPASEAENGSSVDPKAAHYDEIIRQWVFDNIHGGHIGRSTECWAELSAALPALTAALLKGD